MLGSGVSISIVAMVLAQVPSDEAARAASAAQKAAEAAEAAAQAAEAAAQAARRAARAAEETAAHGFPSKKEEKPAENRPEEKRRALWSGTLGMGFISLAGNARTLTMSLSGSFERSSSGWVVAGKASAVYGESRAVGVVDAQTVALGASLQVRGDRRITERASGYLLGALDTDHIKSVELRPAAEAGMGLLWVENKEGDLLRSRLRTDLAMRYNHERRFQYYPAPLSLPGVTFVGPKLGASCRFAISKDVIFTEDAEALLNIAGRSRVLVTSVTKIASRLIGALSLGVSFTVNNDSQPASDRSPTDTALSVGLELAF